MLCPNLSPLISFVDIQLEPASCRSPQSIQRQPWHTHELKKPPSHQRHLKKRYLQLEDNSLNKCQLNAKFKLYHIPIIDCRYKIAVCLTLACEGLLLMA